MEFDPLKIFELKPRYLFAIWFLGILILLLPPALSDKFGFTSIVNAYRGWKGLGTLIFLVLWLVQIWGVVIQPERQERIVRQKALDEGDITAARNVDERRKAERQKLELLRTLSKGEQFLLLWGLLKISKLSF